GGDPSAVNEPSISNRGNRDFLTRPYGVDERRRKMMIEHVGEVGQTEGCPALQAVAAADWGRVLSPRCVEEPPDTAATNPDEEALVSKRSPWPSQWRP